MRATLVLGATIALGAFFFACATGDDGATNATGANGADGGAVDATVSADGTLGESQDSDGFLGNDSGDNNTKDAGVDSGPACVPDAGCTTGDPGACGAGTTACGASGATCVPLVTTQACFPSDAGTPGVGICTAGTQTCTGTLGACTGDVGPLAVEDCFNNLDDDCDGKINDGCPVGLSLGTSRTLGGAGGAGGGLNTVMCPTGAFVTRVDSWFDDDDSHASGVSIYCATPTLIQGASSYTVSLAANTPAPYATTHGGNDPKIERTDDCGLSGLPAITYTVGLADNYVEGLGNHCSTSTVTLDATNKITFNFTNGGDESYNAYASSATFFSEDCNKGEVPSNQVVVGFSIHDGAWLDNIAPICAPLVVTYGAGTTDP